LPKVNNVKKALSHPLLLLIVGAIVSSLLIPFYTRQWQDHQKDLELKTDLADQINKAITNAEQMAQYNINPEINKQNDWNEKWHNAYIDWKISSELIGSRITSYFFDDQKTHNWNNLSTAVTEILGLASHINQDSKYNYYMCLRLGHIINMHNLYPHNNPINIGINDFTSYHCENYYIPNLNGIQYFNKYYPAKNGSIDWNALLHHEQYSSMYKTNVANLTEFNRSFLLLVNSIKEQKDSLLQSIYNSTVIVFRLF
jgi:hypothetical protein